MTKELRELRKKLEEDYQTSKIQEEKDKVYCLYCKKQVKTSKALETFRKPATVAAAAFGDISFIHIFPLPSKEFPFHGECFFRWVYQQLRED